MKKFYQIVDVSLSAGEVKSVEVKTRSEYDLVTGLFFVMREGESGETLVSAEIADEKVLPEGADLSAFVKSDRIGRNDAIYDITEEKVPARGRVAVFRFDNSVGTAKRMGVYLLLKNVVEA